MTDGLSMMVASLTVAQRKILDRFILASGFYASPGLGPVRVLKEHGVISGKASSHPWDPKMFWTLTPLGRAVAAEIREKKS